MKERCIKDLPQGVDVATAPTLLRSVVMSLGCFGSIGSVEKICDFNGRKVFQRKLHNISYHILWEILSKSPNMGKYSAFIRVCLVIVRSIFEMSMPS